MANSNQSTILACFLIWLLQLSWCHDDDQSLDLTCSKNSVDNQNQCFMRDYSYTVEERFLRYVQIDTAADPQSTSFPSSSKQKELAEILVQELKDMGIQDAEMDEWGYVFATLESNSAKENVPTVCFCAHVDTSPDVSGTNVKPIVHRNYTGEPIVLPDDPNQIITVEKFPYLASKLGEDIITASGLTLLGSDDKSGVAIIMDAIHFLVKNPQIKHGRLRVLFTPDEELGRGVDHLNLTKLDADYAYTLDGGELGKIEDETFSADTVTITIHGVSAHPGYAKGSMINAIKVAAAIVDALPSDGWSPETTEGREGFVHPMAVQGGASEASLTIILRDHDTALLAAHAARLEAIVRAAVARYPGARYSLAARPQYRNMRGALDAAPWVAAHAERAMRRAGVAPRRALVRGGTDGALLTARGLPCPNLFAGQAAIHSPLEHVCVADMRRAVDTLAHLAAVWEADPPPPPAAAPAP
jgi:tripeptide aminopeptidase